MIVSQGLFAQLLVSVDEACDLVHRDLVDQQILAQVGLELVECIEVVLERVGGKLWFGEEDITFECLGKCKLFHNPCCLLNSE